jgi:antitoxin component YwqK of YwqJK toxin-antitoxin module
MSSNKEEATKPKQEIINPLAPPDSNYTGDFFEKYNNGIIKVRGYFRFGKKSGKWMYFFPNGLMWSEAFFDNDKMHGESNVYHPNGKLMYTGNYNHDVPIGKWMFYDSSGVLANQKVYDSIPKAKK